MNTNKIIYFKAFLALAITVSCSHDNKFNTEESSEIPDLLSSSQSSAVTSTFPIISKSDPRITTHHLTSGTSGFQIGITSNGGGVINEVIIPGIGDIMDYQSDMYGRAGQVAIRDAAHGGVYNPTQAGFNEKFGSECSIAQATDGKSLVIHPRPLACWYGDGAYDYTRWENLGEDDNMLDGKNTDEDLLVEENLKGKQAREVRSEFDYFGTYADLSGKNGINIGIIRHYYKISFIRKPGHCIKQHKAGSKLWDPLALQKDISVNEPQGIHPGSDKDMNIMTSLWSLRHDLKIWEPGHFYYRNDEGKWKRTRSNIDYKTQTQPDNSDGTVFMLADSSNRQEGNAICLYRPKTDININVIIGIDERNDKVIYKDSRRASATITHELRRTPTMSKYGFSDRLRGMINRTQLSDNIYEAYRNEVYILNGTPAEIITAIRKLDRSLGL